MSCGKGLWDFVATKLVLIEKILGVRVGDSMGGFAGGYFGLFILPK